MVAAGADLMTNMYDVKIWFPDASGKPQSTEFNAYPLTVRAAGFELPDAEAVTYDIKYHGITLKKPQAEQSLERKFTIEFREDASFDLRKKLTAWTMAVLDPVTGGVSNATSFFGKVSVGTIVGEYYATTVAPPGDPMTDNTGILRKDGYLSNNINPIAVWNFYNVWINKITSPKFQTETSGPGKFSVDFNYMDLDMPQFGGNALTADAGWSWAVGQGAA